MVYNKNRRMFFLVFMTLFVSSWSISLTAGKTRKSNKSEDEDLAFLNRCVAENRILKNKHNKKVALEKEIISLEDQEEYFKNLNIFLDLGEKQKKILDGAIFSWRNFENGTVSTINKKLRFNYVLTDETSQEVFCLIARYGDLLKIADPLTQENREFLTEESKSSEIRAVRDLAGVYLTLDDNNRLIEKRIVMGLQLLRKILFHAEKFGGKELKKGLLLLATCVKVDEKTSLFADQEFYEKLVTFYNHKEYGLFYKTVLPVYHNIFKSIDNDSKLKKYIVQFYKKLEKTRRLLDKIQKKETVVKKKKKLEASVLKVDEVIVPKVLSVLKLQDKKKYIKKNKNIDKKESVVKKIFFKSKPSEDLPFTSSLGRVTGWFDDPDKELIKQSYDDFGVSLKNWIKKIHGFTDIVNSYIQSLAIACQWTAEGAREGDVSYNLPAEILDHDTGKKYVGVISYGVSKDGLLFHRCFSERKYEAIKKDVERRTYDITFPKLGESKSAKWKKCKRFDNEEIVFQNNFHVKIEDKFNNLTIFLLKAK